MKKKVLSWIMLPAMAVCLLAVPANCAAAAEPGTQAASETDAADIQAATMMEALDRVNVRTAPDTEAELLGQLEQGEKLFAVELTEEGWYRVVWQGETGYVRSDFLKVYGTEDWDAPESADAAGPSGEVINPEEEVQKASEEAAKRESEAIERAASAEAAAAEAAAQAEAEQKRRSRNTVLGVLAGAVLLIAGYAAVTIVKELKNPQEEADGEAAEEDAVGKSSASEREAGQKDRGRGKQERQESEDMDFVDLDL